jgi:hypothetical protein
LADDCQFGFTVGAPPRLRERVALALRLDNAVLVCRARTGPCLPGPGAAETLRQISINPARRILGQNRQALGRSAALFEAQQEEPSRDCWKPDCSLLVGNRRRPPPRRRQRKRRALPSWSILPLPFLRFFSILILFNHREINSVNFFLKYGYFISLFGVTQISHHIVTTESQLF